MAKEKRQIGVKVDQDVWQRFRQNVKDRHGSVRGVLGIEVENALIDYIESERADDRLARIEDDVATIVGVLSEREQTNSDGGSTLPSASSSESTRARISDKPKANQPRTDKLDYLLSELLADEPCNRESGELPKANFSDIVKSKYDFSDDTVSEYKDRLISRLDAQEHPKHGVTVAWGERYDDIVEELRDEADDEMSTL
jgi:hypothetical protein